MASTSAKLENYHDILLKDSPLTAEDFAQVWEHFDADGNGFIEGKELENFFKELIGPKIDSKKYSETVFEQCVRDIMEDYDENKDGKIEMRELAEFLHPDENFLFFFRAQQPITSVEFMGIWRKFDEDSNGFIEAAELKRFIKHLITKGQGKDEESAEDVKVTDEQLEEYSQTILKLFDTNNDGKLELKEMAKLLPTKENFLKQFQCATGGRSLGKGFLGQKPLTRSQFERVFSYYDRDNNGTIEGDELLGFLKDLMEHERQEELNAEKLEECCKSFLAVCDKNHDGIIQKSELEMLIKPSEDPEPQE